MGRSGPKRQKLSDMDVVMGSVGGEPDLPLQNMNGDGTRRVVLGHGFSRSQGDEVDPQRAVPDKSTAASAMGLLALGPGDARLFGSEVKLEWLARKGPIDGWHGQGYAEGG